MRRFSDDMIVVGLPEDQWLADTRVRDGNIVAFVTEGANQGKHKLFNGQNVFADLSYVEDSSPGGGGTWGTITGTLSAQTDLQAALDAKALQPIRITRADAEDAGGSGAVVPVAGRFIQLTDTHEIFEADGVRNILAITALYNVQSGTTYATQDSDIGRTIRCTSSSPVTVTINHPRVRVKQDGTGQVTLVGGSGITLSSLATLVSIRTAVQGAYLEVLPTPTATTFDVCGLLEV